MILQFALITHDVREWTEAAASFWISLDDKPDLPQLSQLCPRLTSPGDLLMLTGSFLLTLDFCSDVYFRYSLPNDRTPGFSTLARLASLAAESWVVPHETTL